MFLKNIKKILVINLGGIGDALLSTPGLRTLKKAYPDAKVYLLVTRHTSRLMKQLPYIEQAFAFYLNLGLVSTFNNLKTLFILRKLKFDLAINMRTLVSKGSALKIKLLLDLINPRIKAGRNTSGRGTFFDIKINEPDIGEKFEMEYDIETVGALGAQVTEKDIDLRIEENSLNSAARILRNEGISVNDTLVGMHLGGKPSHQWPQEFFLLAWRVIQKLAKCKLVVTGEKKDAIFAKKVFKNTDIINLAGKLNIRELAALIKRCSVYISNDTGPMHIAAALKTPLVAIFGPGYLYRYDPRNISDRVIVLYKRVGCSPCNRITCGSMKCLKAILPQEVAGAVLSLLRLDRGKI